MLQTVNYVSDAEGFKVAATNLPHAPVAESLAKPVAVVAPTVKVAPIPVAKPVPIVAPQVKAIPQSLIPSQIVPLGFDKQIFDDINVVAPDVTATETAENDEEISFSHNLTYHQQG